MLLLVAITCTMVAKPQALTINFEQEGNGTPQIQYWSVDNFLATVDLVPGKNTFTDIKFYRNPLPGTQTYKLGYHLTFIPNPASEIKDIIIDGASDLQASMEASMNGSFFKLVEEQDYEFSMKFVYDETEQEVYTQNIYGKFQGEGTVQCDYTDADGSPVSVTLNAGDNKLNVMQEADGSYRMRITPKPGAGLECTYLVADDYDEYALLEEFEEKGYADIVYYETMVTKNLDVHFDEPDEYDIAVEYSVYGSGGTNYSYVSESTGEEVTSWLKLGENVFEDIKFDGAYSLRIIPVPAEDYLVSAVMLDGVANEEALAEYEENGYFTLTSAEGREDFELEMVYEHDGPIEVIKHTVTLKANGDVAWYIAHSNVQEGRQDRYDVNQEDVVIELPDGAFCSWNYSYNYDYVVRGLLIDGEMLEGYTFTVDRDMEISLDYVSNEQWSVSVNKPTVEGDIFLEYQSFNMEIGDYEWLTLPEGQTVNSGTVIRASIYAYVDYAISEIKVNGTPVVTFTREDDVYRYDYQTEVYENMAIEVEFYDLVSVNDVNAAPVEMQVYAVDGRLVKTCVASDAEEATQGLPAGIYIVNGEKVAVDGIK